MDENTWVQVHRTSTIRYEGQRMAEIVPFFFPITTAGPTAEFRMGAIAHVRYILKF